MDKHSPTPTQTGRILIVDDEMALRFFIADMLVQANWTVHEADSGEAALVFLDQQAVDIVLLDLRMAGIDGVSVLREIKNLWPETLVIIMTAYATLESAIESVRHSAFDYLQKPCGSEKILEVLNRALATKRERERAVSAQPPEPLTVTTPTPAPERVITSGNLQVNLASRQVSKDGQIIQLTPTEYELLVVLMQSLGEPVSLEMLIEAGLGHLAEDRQLYESLRVHISRLRQKVGNGYIHTVRGGGYVLVDLPTSY